MTITKRSIETKMNRLMYSLTKDASRDSFSEYLEDLDITDEEYRKIKEEFAKIGVAETYV